MLHHVSGFEPRQRVSLTTISSLRGFADTLTKALLGRDKLHAEEHLFEGVAESRK